MNSELQLIARKLEQAGSPEEVFGMVGESGEDPAAGLKKTYHYLAKLTHPDRYQSGEDQTAAQAAFQRLGDWYAQAEQKLKAGTYGQADTFLILTRKRTYQIRSDYSESGPYNCYFGEYDEGFLIYPVTIKLARDPQDNDLAQNEATALQVLTNGRAAKKFWPYIPRLLDSFLYEIDGERYQGNIFERLSGWYALEEVRRAYPKGIDPRDMAWMWRRVLVALGFAHINGLVHGAVLPGNVLIQPEKHGVMLVEWSFSVPDASASGLTIPAINPDYEAWYPPEVQARETPLPGTDIAMAARCMIYLLGGDPVTVDYPKDVPDFLQSFFKGCVLPGKRARPQDAWALLEEFDDLIRRNWGERKFRPFVIHPTT